MSFIPSLNGENSTQLAKLVILATDDRQTHNMALHHPTITEHEIVTFLQDIEAGRVVLSPLEDPQLVYTSNVTYKASNGWTLVIFISENEWDYIDSISSDDGRTVDYDDIYVSYWRVMSEYEPTGDVAWRRYHLPGNMRFRCKTCDIKILGGTNYRNHKTECG